MAFTDADPLPSFERECPEESNQHTTLVMDTTWECIVTGAEQLMKMDLQNKKEKFKKLMLKRKLLIGNIADVQTALELFKMNKPKSKNKKSLLSKKSKRKLGIEIVVDAEEKEIIEKNSLLDIYRRKLKNVTKKMNKMKSKSLGEINVSKTNKKLLKKLRILENETPTPSPVLAPDNINVSNEVNETNLGEINVSKTNTKLLKKLGILENETPPPSPVLEPCNIIVSNEVNETNSSIDTAEAKLKSLVRFLSDHISSKESSIECPVCYTLPTPPIYRCPNSHIICNSCLPRLARKCPTCRTRLGPKQIHGQAESNWGELNRLKMHMKELGLM